jgi:hypothetical protein
MSLREMKWSKMEKEAARRAFEGAYRKECGTIAAKIKEMAAAASEPEDLWRIHDVLTKRRRQTDEKYDYRYSVLLFVFARLLREEWISETDLQALADDKIESIRYLAGCGESGPADQ